MANVGFYRLESKTKIFGLPLYSIAFGGDPEKNEKFDRAKGIIAIGDIATGIFAVGIFTRSCRH